MPATVGGVAVDLIKGYPDDLTEQMRKWRVDGADGWAALKLGKGGGPFDVIVTKWGTNSAVNIWITSIRALSATVISIVYDQYGMNETVSNLMVERARPAPDLLKWKRPSINPAIPGGWRADMRLTGVKKA